MTMGTWKASESTLTRSSDVHISALPSTGVSRSATLMDTACCKLAPVDCPTVPSALKFTLRELTIRGCRGRGE